MKKYFFVHSFFIIILIFYSIGLFSKPLFPVENFFWGDIEFISTDKKFQKSEYTKDFPHKLGERVTEENIYDAFFWCKRNIEENILPGYTECDFIPDERNKKLYFVVNLSSNPFPILNENKNISAVFLKPILMRLNYAIEEKLQSLWGVDRDKTEKIFRDERKRYYLGFNDIELNMEAKKIFTSASDSKKNIFEVLQLGKDLEERSHAAHLLNWSGLTKKDMTILINQFPDISNEINIKLINIFNTFYFLIPNENKKILFAKSIQFLQTYDLELCSVNLVLIENLVSENKNFIHSLTDEQKYILSYLANNSVIPKIYKPAKTLNNYFL